MENRREYVFDNQKGTFTFTEPETGKGWYNYIFNNISYVTGVSHLGFTISRYVNEDSVQVNYNNGGSYLYIRDNESKEYWNVSGYPSIKSVNNYKCTHGQQFSTISSDKNGIAASITYVVAPDDTYEIWEVTLTNESENSRSIDLFATTDFDMNGFEKPYYYFANNTCYTEYFDDINCVYCQNLNPCRPHNLCSAYIMSSEKVKAFDGSIKNFMGTVGSLTKPYILEKGLDCTNRNSTVHCLSGIIQNEIHLAPNESKTVYYILGIAETVEKLRLKRECILRDAAGAVLAAKSGEERYGHLRTKCPDEQFNNIFNYWIEHQVSYCMVGKKAVRDNAQIALALLNYDIPNAKKAIDECLAHQYSDGHAMLLWMPFIEPYVYSDPSAWLTFAVCAYVKETGDFDYLSHNIPYFEGENATVYEHLKQAVKWFEREDNYGENMLPRIHHADWNDALNIPDEKAESVLMSMLICKVYKDIIELAEFIGDNEYAEALKESRQKLVAKTNEVAFNGEYYVRAFSKFGVVGDKSCENGGKIYVNPQSWSIISEVCPENRLESVLKAIDSMETDEGIPVCYPSYSKYDESVGRMSGMPAGVYENGGIYNHAGCFKVVADCKVGRGENAVNALKKIIPDGENNPSTKTCTEPFVFTNCYLKHPSVDMRVGFSWQTGTSAWGLISYYEGILGLQRGYDGLHILPALPKNWKNVEAQRYYRGNKLFIKYINNGGKNVSLVVDGNPIEGNVIPLFCDELTHEITVILER